MTVQSVASGISCRSYFLEQKNVTEPHVALALHFQTEMKNAEKHLLQLLNDIEKSTSNHIYNRNLSELATFNNWLLSVFENLNDHQSLYDSDSKMKIYYNLVSMAGNLFVLQGISYNNINQIIESHFKYLALTSKPDNINPIGFVLTNEKKHSTTESIDPVLTDKKIGFLRRDVEKELYGRVKPIVDTNKTPSKSIGFLTSDQNVNGKEPFAELPTIGFIQQDRIDINYRNNMIFRSDLGVFEIQSNRPRIGF